MWLQNNLNLDRATKGKCPMKLELKMEVIPKEHLKLIEDRRLKEGSCPARFVGSHTPASAFIFNTLHNYARK